ncbi:ATP-binding cassette domain-containing protein, partial [bacterium]|nr:ATP-binding cassette domain-containing protein [bacterium]
MKNKIVEVKNLSFRFKKDSNDFFKNLNFDIYENEKIIIFGLNGSGKSTLAKLFVGLYVASSGSINYLNSTVKAAMVMQNPDNAIIGKTVEEEFAFSLQNLNLTYEQMHNKFDEIIKLMDLEKYVKADINSLSG